MARELVTNIWCDVCLTPGEDAEPEYTPAKEHPPVTVGMLQPRVVALCDTHRKELFEPFETLIREHGQTPGKITDIPKAAAPKKAPKTRATGAPIPCPDPACEKHANPYENSSSLTGHARNAHGMTLNQLREKHGIAPVNPIEAANKARLAAATASGPGPVEGVALTDRESDREAEDPDPIRLVCPVDDCGKVWAKPEYKQPRKARGVHMSKVHGIKSTKPSNVAVRKNK